MNPQFELHPRLAKDCAVVTDLPLCRLLLVNDSRFPWCILVPRRENIRELYQLNDDDQHQFLLESNHLSHRLMQHFDGEKLNLAALGNRVPQLHVHHIVRLSSDAAWPAPVWGVEVPVPYSANMLQQHLNWLISVTKPLLV